ncbi:hypothetical protein [Microbacterium sp. SZ1]|nr:hypothetical protein [Microbacterium sp. SZ1]
MRFETIRLAYPDEQAACVAMEQPTGVDQAVSAMAPIVHLDQAHQAA